MAVSEEPLSSGAIVLPGVVEAIRLSERIIAASVGSLTAADAGHFGPGSMSWAVFRHPSYSISGIAAVLIQALHPVAMSAIDRNSHFRRDAWRRAHMTADYVFTITFSARAVATAAAERVRRIHSQIAGVEPVSARQYRADDPDLLLWVHCVHTRYALLGFDRYARPVSPQERDRFVCEQIMAAELVGLSREAVPHDWACLNAYFAGIGDFAPTRPAIDFCKMLLHACMPLTLRPFWALHIVGAAALLSKETCSAYGLAPWLPRGPFAQLSVKAALWAIDRGFALFGPVRRARAKLRAIERATIVA